MSKKVAISQSNYIPWKGYFDLINTVDEFVLYDDMQFTRRDWRNRNRIKTANGPHWLTIPVDVKGKYHHKIKDIQGADSVWRCGHCQTLRHSYSKAPFFKTLEPFLYLARFANYLISVDTAELADGRKLQNPSAHFLREAIKVTLQGPDNADGGTETVSIHFTCKQYWRPP